MPRGDRREISERYDEELQHLALEERVEFDSGSGKGLGCCKLVMRGGQQEDDRICFNVGSLGGKAQQKIKKRVVGVASNQSVFMRISPYIVC